MRALRTFKNRLCLSALLSTIVATNAFAQRALSWQEVRDQFEALNPTLRAGLISVDESKAEEITAYLRPNPNLAVTTDGIQAAPYQGVWQPLKGATISPNISYLHERRHKRELRLRSAQKATAIAVSNQDDLHRTLVSTLRAAFIQVLQEKAILALAKENMAYYDHVLEVNRERFRAGAIAQVDLDRLELQRVIYEADLQTAMESLETAKIQLLMLLNDRTSPDQFDVAGPFDFSPQIPRGGCGYRRSGSAASSDINDFLGGHSRFVACGRFARHRFGLAAALCHCDRGRPSCRPADEHFFASHTLCLGRQGRRQVT